MTNLITTALLLTASWERFSDIGKQTAGGGHYNPKAMTCATRLWPLGATLLVRETHNGSQVTVRVTDRPAARFGATRIDLSAAAFKKLNGLELGLCEVAVARID